MTQPLSSTALGARVQTLREQRDWTRYDLTTRAHVTLDAVTRLEQGQGDPLLTDLAALARTLGLHLHELISPGDDDGLKRLAGLRVRNLRRSRDLSQNELAERLDVANLKVHLIETGQMNLTLSDVAQLAEVFGVSRGTLLDFSDVAPLDPQQFGQQVRRLLADATPDGADIAARTMIGPELLKEITEGRAPLTLNLLTRLTGALGVQVSLLTILPE